MTVLSSPIDALGPLLPALTARFGEAAVQAQLEALARHGDAVDNPVLWLTTALERGFRFMPITVRERCACGSWDFRLVGRHIYWNLLATRECQVCGALFVSPRLAPEAMERIFSHFYFDASPQDLAFWGERRRPVFEQVRRLLAARGVTSVLDVGAAYGHFVHHLRAHGFRASGIDLSPVAAETARAVLGVDVRTGRLPELNPLPEPVDAVVSLDTLYYADDPGAELTACHAVTRPRGWLVLRLRNGLWSRAKMVRATPDRPGPRVMPAEHLWSWTPEAIRRLLALTGWRLEAIEPGAWPDTPRSRWLNLAPRIIRRRRRLARHMPVLAHSFVVVARRCR
ncbi:MAG: class I SAM-dependent methyltransferase [Gemmatimonadota bacterium]